MLPYPAIFYYYINNGSRRQDVQTQDLCVDWIWQYNIQPFVIHQSKSKALYQLGATENIKLKVGGGKSLETVEWVSLSEADGKHSWAMETA